MNTVVHEAKVPAAGESEVVFTGGLFIAHANTARDTVPADRFFCARVSLVPSSSAPETPKPVPGRSPESVVPLSRITTIPLPWFSIKDDSRTDQEKVLNSSHYTLIREDCYSLHAVIENDTDVSQTKTIERRVEFVTDKWDRFQEYYKTSITMGASMGRFSASTTISSGFTHTITTYTQTKIVTGETVQITCAPQSKTAYWVLRSRYRLLAADGHPLADDVTILDYNQSLVQPIKLN